MTALPLHFHFPPPLPLRLQDEEERRDPAKVQPPPKPHHAGNVPHCHNLLLLLLFSPPPPFPSCLALCTVLTLLPPLPGILLAAVLSFSHTDSFSPGRGLERNPMQGGEQLERSPFSLRHHRPGSCDRGTDGRTAGGGMMFSLLPLPPQFFSVARRLWRRQERARLSTHTFTGTYLQSAERERDI